MTTTTRRRDDLDFGLEFTEPGDHDQRRLIPNEFTDAILGARPAFIDPEACTSEVATLIWAIDAFAWWVKRAIAELTDQMLAQLPVVRVDWISSQLDVEVKAATVGQEIIVNSDLDPIAGMAALLEHIQHIHIPTKSADSLHWAMRR